MIVMPSVGVTDRILRAVLSSTHYAADILLVAAPTPDTSLRLMRHEQRGALAARAFSARPRPECRVVSYGIVLPLDLHGVG